MGTLCPDTAPQLPGSLLSSACQYHPQAVGVGVSPQEVLVGPLPFRLYNCESSGLTLSFSV